MSVRHGPFSVLLEIEYTFAYLSLDIKHKWQSFWEIIAIWQSVMASVGDIFTKLTVLCSIYYVEHITTTIYKGDIIPPDPKRPVSRVINTS